MNLRWLKIKNFKGIKELDIAFGGKDATISGHNGAGKSTIYDSFAWLLFGRDSLNNPSFEVKTIDPETGKVVHELDHGVEAEFDDGTILARTYREKWSRPRGSATKELVGHETTYEVNGSKVTKGNYEKAVAELVDNADFRLLSDPMYFNTALKPLERRSALMSLVEVDDSALMTEELIAALGGRSAADAKNLLVAKRRELKRELDAIPVRISEAKRALPDESLNVAEIEARIKELESGGDELEKYEEAQRRVEAIRTEFQIAQRALDAKAREAHQEWTAARGEFTAAAARVATLRSSYAAQTSGTCPTCGQAQVVAEADKEALLAEGKAAAELERGLRAKEDAAREAYLAAQAAADTPPSEAHSLEDALADQEKAREAWRVARQGMAEAEALRRDLERAKSADAVRERIDSLLAEEKEVAQKYEAVEAQIFTLEQFERDRVALVEDAINARFSLVKFKLFEHQINGGIAETCITTVNGVPYDNLNTAGRVHAGLDIIRTLQEHHGVRMPVWIDSREGVLELPEMDCQMISLVVKPGPLDIEVGGD